MKLTILLVLVAALAISDIDRIAKINSMKSEAQKAYKSGDYKTAAEKYQYLIDSLQVNEEEVTMNLANAYFQLRDTVKATSKYQSLVESSSSKMRTLSNQQLGVLSNRMGKYEEALSYFKQALKADPTNEDARYNYELVKKKLEEQKKQEQQNQDQKKQDQEKKDDQKKDSEDQKKDQKDQQDKKDQEKKDQQEQQDKEKQDQEKKDSEKNDEQKDQEQKDQEQEKKDIPPSVKEKLEQMEMSEEKARMILEAMKNQEIQYLQQNKRKATKPKDKGKPDW